MLVPVELSNGVSPSASVPDPSNGVRSETVPEVLINPYSSGEQALKSQLPDVLAVPLSVIEASNPRSGDATESCQT